MAISARIETPLVKRSWETTWAIPEVSRISLTGESDDDIQTILRLVVELAPRDAPYIVEAEELWSSPKKVSGVTGVRVMELEDFRRGTGSVVFRAGEPQVISCDGSFYVFAVDPSALPKLLSSLEVKEWYLYSLPSRDFVPFGLRKLAEFFGDRYDRFVIENMGPADPLGLFSQNHRDLELLTRSPSKIAERLCRLGDGNRVFR